MQKSFFGKNPFSDGFCQDSIYLREANFSGSSGLGGQLLAELEQVIGNGPQSDPTFHPVHPVIVTAEQFVFAFQHADVFFKQAQHFVLEMRIAGDHSGGRWLQNPLGQLAEVLQLLQVTLEPDFFLQRLITSVLQVLQHQQPQHHFRRSRLPAPRPAVRMPLL